MLIIALYFIKEFFNITIFFIPYYFIVRKIIPVTLLLFI